MLEESEDKKGYTTIQRGRKFNIFPIKIISRLYSEFKFSKGKTLKKEFEDFSILFIEPTGIGGFRGQYFLTKK